MKKVCFLVGNLDCSGGTERVTSLIANKLASLNYKISILSITDGLNPFFFLKGDIKITSLNSKDTSFKKQFLNIVLKIRNFVKNEKIDTFIVVDSLSCIFTVPALVGLNVNHICWEHFNFNVDLGVNYRKIARKWAAKYCNYVVTLTKKDKELWINGIKNKKALFISIPNPSTFENINYTPDINSKIILSVGRYRYQKGYDLLIESWNKVRDKKGWKLLLVGDGEEKESLLETIEKLKLDNTIELCSSTNNIENYFKNAAFYCMSSRFEGLPMVLIEAQSFGLPIISFDCLTGPAEIIEDGVSGVLVESENCDELSIAIQSMIDINIDDYKSMSEMARENAKKFSMDSIINSWINII